MSTTISPAIPKTTEPIGRSFDRAKARFTKTSNNFGRTGRTRRMPDNFVRIGDTFATTARISSMTDVIFKLIVTMVRDAATRPEKIDASCTTISKTYKPTVGRTRTNLPTKIDAVTNSDFDRCSARPSSVLRINSQKYGKRGGHRVRPGSARQPSLPKNLPVFFHVRERKATVRFEIKARVLESRKGKPPNRGQLRDKSEFLPVQSQESAWMTTYL